MIVENSFQNFHVEFNRRQVNRIVHQLAQTTPLYPNPYIIDRRDFNDFMLGDFCVI